MLEFINEPVSVEVRLHEDGSATPLAFVWRGRRHEVESWGRQGAEKLDDGRTVRTYLVQTAGPETWQLCLDTEATQWTVTRHWASGSQVV
jgi:hypothetical protein